MKRFGGWVVGGGLVTLVAFGCSDSGRNFGHSSGGSGNASGAGDGGDVADTGVGGAGDVVNTGVAGGGDVAETGAGGDATVGDVCVADQPACDGNRATTCNADGTGYLAAGSKCSSKQPRLAGACEDLECSPSADFCSGNSVRRCADNGLSSDEVMECGSDEYCDVASASCKKGVCAPDQPACDGKRATLCNSTGDGYAAGGTVCKATESCDAGECKAHVCTPSESVCQGQDVKTCSDDGLSSSIDATCTNQTCVAAAGSAACQGECAVGQKDCSNNGVRTCDATGQYGTASKCTNKTCVVSGATASCVGKCAPTQKQCSGNGVATCGESGDWDAASPCADATPYCVSGACKAPPSCTSLAANCGPSSESCCTSLLVSGGPFERENDAEYPANVSDFRLDKYEVTVGRFRKFVSAVVGGWVPGAGSGKHAHLNGGSGLKNSAAAGYEPGWKSTWNTDYLPTDKATWDGEGALGCNDHSWTPSSGSNEALPINCVDWFKAQAFCIWDGGFLPSEAEWNYAAVGGDAQRAYPWGSTLPGGNTKLAVYGCYFNGGNGTCSGVANIAPVGSVPAGNGLFGQADLAGNVWEWNLDDNEDYGATCDDCAYVPVSDTYNNSRRGGAYNSLSVSDLVSRSVYPSFWIESQNGLRCARLP